MRPVLVPSIVTPRLELVSMSYAFMQSSLDGRVAEAAALLGASLPCDWPRGAEHVLSLRIAQLAEDPASQPWLLRAIVLRERPIMIGRTNFHAPPDASGAVENGYSIEPEHRRRGCAQEAVEAMFAWALREHPITRFIASVSPTNEPSLGLTRKLGFRPIGTQWDEIDGEELVFELRADQFTR
jgi:RimJ/RimL family protein N-acetyltransferase